MYAQSVKIIHLKSGLDARGTITESNDSIVRLQTESGKTVSIYTIDIESMEEEKSAFDPKVLVGKWKCYKASGERISDYDFEIKENRGFYTLEYKEFIGYKSNKGFIGGPESTPCEVDNKNIDVNIDANGEISFGLVQTIMGISDANSSRKAYQSFIIVDDIVINLRYNVGELIGNIDCLNHTYAHGHYNYFLISEAIEEGRGRIISDGPGDKYMVYFIKQ